MITNPPPAAATPQQDRRIPASLWVLIAAAFIIAMGYGLIAPVLPQLAHTFSVSYTATTVVVTSFAAFRLLGAPLAGVLVQRFAERPIYIAGVCIVAASSAAIAVAQNYWQLLLFRSLGGIGSVMFTVAALGLLVKLSPPHIRGKASAAYGAMFLIGNIAGPILGGLLAARSVQLPFLAYAVALSVAGVVVGAFLPRNRHGATTPVALPPITLTEAWGDRAFRAALLTGFGNGWANLGIRISLIPLFVAAMISADTRASGVAMAAFAMGNAAVLPFSARFVDTVGRKPMVLLGAATCGAFTMTVGLSTTLPVLLAVSAVAGAGAGALNPGQQAAVADVIGSQRSAGRVLAAFQMVQDIGAIVGSMVGGLVADAFGFNWAFAVSGVVLVVTMLPWLSAPDTLRRARN